MDDIIETLRIIRSDIEQLKRMHKSTPSKVICKGVTGKGTPCRNGVFGDLEYCKMHNRVEKLDIPKIMKRVPKEKKMKKVQPEHNHELGIEPTETCILCETHGDVLDPSLPSRNFEGDEGLEERLRILLENE